MLIDSPRITDRDRAAWDRLHRYDVMLAQAQTWPGRIERAVAEIARWWAGDDGTGNCSVSWGKDSVVVAHLTALSGLPIPLVWVRSDPFETPECEQVRDAFLARHPRLDYREVSVPLRNPKRGEPGHEDHVLNRRHPSQDVLREALGRHRYISGVRAQESRVRDLSIASRGLTTANTCRPIGRWSAADVFAYLAREDLPIHPVYAMSMGGVMDRQWLRVHPLCSTLSHTKTDHAGWELRYYGDHIRAALAQRAAWRAVGDPRGGVNVPKGES